MNSSSDEENVGSSDEDEDDDMADLLGSDSESWDYRYHLDTYFYSSISRRIVSKIEDTLKYDDIVYHLQISLFNIRGESRR